MDTAGIDRQNTIQSNLKDVHKKIYDACKRSGRDPKDVTLVSVSKTKPFEDIVFASQAGETEFGENYVQELMEKIKISEDREWSSGINWHMIGHLQKNKVRYLIGQTSLIHSVDSVDLAKQIEKEAAKRNQVMRILLEVNIANEETKWGLKQEEVLDAAKEIIALQHIRVLGLMTSAPYTEDPETNRLYFRALKNMAYEMESKALLSIKDPKYRGPELSMGMTGDYEVAIEEGATIVRVGTGIFGDREYVN